jgi:hypothetical protein
VHAREDGIHTFTLSSDDGSRLRVGGDLVIDHDGLHGPSALAGQIALAAGWHSIEITYFQAGGGRSLDLHIAPPARPSVRLPLDAIAFRP